jgi:hypothetical protein
MQVELSLSRKVNGMLRQTDNLSLIEVDLKMRVNAIDNFLLLSIFRR